MNRSRNDHSATSCNWYFPSYLIALNCSSPSTSYRRYSCRSAFNLLRYSLGALSFPPEKEGLIYVSASKVNGIRTPAARTAIKAWVKEIKSIWQVKGQTQIIHPVKSQNKYLVSQTFDLWRRSENIIYRSATPLLQCMNQHRSDTKDYSMTYLGPLLILNSAFEW